jgi:AcrR family transcriptional regulator
MSKQFSQKKRLIFTEAAKLFQEKGYLASSMRELATRVGIEASSLYSHIRSKEELLSKICFELAEMYVDHWRKLEKTENSSLEKLEELIDFHVSMAWENPVSVTVFNDEWRHLGAEDQKKFIQLRKQYESAIKHVVAEGIRQKEIKSLDPDVISYTLLHGLRWIHFTHRKGNWLSKTAMQDQLKSLFLAGIQKNN